MTGGFTPEYGNRFGGVLDITTRSGAIWAAMATSTCAARPQITTISMPTMAAGQGG
jgi:hypothetical protein